MLDADEFLHLAIHASAKGEHHACMTYLHEVLKQRPGDPRALYLLAVQHAGLGLMKRAVAGLEAALAIEPKMETARFQLGLLLFECKHHARARAKFSELAGSADPVLRNCSAAMLALIDRDVNVARAKLASVMTKEVADHPLFVLIQQLVQQLAADPGNAMKEEGSIATLLGTYRLNLSGEARR